MIQALVAATDPLPPLCGTACWACVVFRGIDGRPVREQRRAAADPNASPETSAEPLVAIGDERGHVAAVFQLAQLVRVGARPLVLREWVDAPRINPAALLLLLGGGDPTYELIQSDVRLAGPPNAAADALASCSSAAAMNCSSSSSSTGHGGPFSSLAASSGAGFEVTVSGKRSRKRYYLRRPGRR